MVKYEDECVGCPICSDGKSYPEKFIASYLRQIGEPFITEYSAKWSNDRRYDFYLPNMNMFIEVDGGIGHGKKTGLESLQFPVYVCTREVGKEVSYN